MPDHVRQVHKPGEYCKETDHPGTCWVCNLFLCAVCGALEGALLPECPGKKLTDEEHEENYRHYCNGTGPFAAGRRRHLKTLLTAATIPIVPKGDLGPVSQELFDLSKPPGACGASGCVAQAGAGRKFCSAHNPQEIVRRAKEIVRRAIDEWGPANLDNWTEGHPIEELRDKILKDLEGTI